MTQPDFAEGFHEHGAVICDGCNTRIDLSDADTVHEAGGIWDAHLENECPDYTDESDESTDTDRQL